MVNFLGGSKYVSDLSRVGKRVGGNKGVGASSTSHENYDFIIVGGGTAGCVLAARLTEDPSLRVLVLESGGSGKSLFFSRLPSGATILYHGKHVYEFHTEPQESANGRKRYWPRGKMLGGCSSINGQMAQYGAPSDFTEWAQIIEDDSWVWGKLQPYFRKFEKYVPSPNYTAADADTIASGKGSTGPVEVGYSYALHQQSQDFVTSCMKLGIPFNPDFNAAGGTMGVNRIMTYIDKQSKRVSSETAYFTKEVLARPNLVVAVHAQVTKIIFAGTQEGPRAIGVEFAATRNGPRYEARARKEVILSAGAIHSPQILLLSGVGDSVVLQEHKIPLVYPLPSVGSHLVDHPAVHIAFRDKNPVPKYLRPHSVMEVFKALGAMYSYFSARRGPLTSNLAEAVAFIRSDDPSIFDPEEYPVKLHDTTSDVSSPDLELISTVFGFKNHGEWMYPISTVGLIVVLLRPASEGCIRLKTSSPWDNPIIDPSYLQKPEDLRKLVRGLKAVLKLASTEPLASRIDIDKEPLLDQALLSKSDKELEDVVRDRLETLYHPTSTCRMAPLNDGGVVDAELRVYGIQGLRVCDASVFPKIVAGHTAGAVLAVAEKLSDMLKEQYSPSLTTRRIPVGPLV